MREKNDKGITLIALIITIIVLLILAGVSIAMLTGKNGILSKAEGTEYAQAHAELTEEIVLSMTESVMETMATDDHEHTISEVLNIAKNNGYINDDEHTIVVLGTNGVEEETVTLIGDVTSSCTKAKVIHNKTGAFVIITLIGNGEIVVGDEEQGTGNGSDSNQGSGDNNGNEDDANGGLTIPEIAEDGIILEEDTTIKDGNGDDITIPGGFGVPEDTEEDPLADRDTVEEGFVIRDRDGNEFVWVPAFPGNQAAEKLYAVESDGVYEGVGNDSYYEPGLLEHETYGDSNPTYNTIGLTEEILRKEFEEMQASVKKRGGFYIMRYELSNYNSTAMSQKNQIAANGTFSSVIRWWGLYNLAKTYTNGDIKSTMIANSQYDIMVEWITEEVMESKVNDRNMSNTTTGIEPTDKIRNIYDLTGGKHEWTTSVSGSYSRAIRGGSYSSTDPASYTGSYYAYYSFYQYGTRSTLIW